MQTAFASRLTGNIVRPSRILDAYELADIKPSDMPMVMLIPFAFAFGAANLIWLFATGADPIYLLAAAFGPAVIVAIWLPATANLRHRARSAWGKDAKLNMIISAIITSIMITTDLAIEGIEPLRLIAMMFIAAWNPALHGGLLLSEARAWRRCRHIGEFAIFQPE